MGKDYPTGAGFLKLFGFMTQDRISGMTADPGRARLKLNRIRPKKYAFKGAQARPQVRTSKFMLTLDSHDEALVAATKNAIESAIANAHMPVAVIKRISVFAVRHRNRGRLAAMKRHPYRGVCEASGAPLDRKHAHLDELEPELGYGGKVRWICPRANNSGTQSCGVCR